MSSFLHASQVVSSPVAAAVEELAGGGTVAVEVLEPEKLCGPLEVAALQAAVWPESVSVTSPRCST